jgi:hypothetical protein
MGTFRKYLFINSPEVLGQVVRLLIYGWDDEDAKVSKSPIWINKKSRVRAHLRTSAKFLR